MTDLLTIYEILSRSEDLRGKWESLAVEEEDGTGDVIRIRTNQGNYAVISFDAYGNII